ncbi:DUF502 domain-containing protein [Woodsholea maritima]|uniref:DUF502 domain-containing protein n=1 Tax=Woodsholea maritima TaxID=240237 RepID=UPI00036D08B8|nr:DUF502 domain-containing protein [Woodsholea maritima]
MLRWLRNSFLTGIVVATPVAVTIWIVYTFINFVDSTVKPLIPMRYNPESYLPFAIPGMGLLIAIVGLTLLGALAANIFGRTLISIGERLVNSLPLVRNVYGALKQIVETVMAGKENSFKEVVLVEYPMAGHHAVAFVSAQAKGAIANELGEDVIGVFVPTTPNPTSGFLLFTPRSKTIKLDMSVEEAAKLIISFGLVTPERLPKGAIPSKAPAKTGHLERHGAGEDQPNAPPETEPQA